MPRYAIRPVDPADPRPTFHSDDVLLTAIRSVSPAIIAWAKTRATPAVMEEAHLEFALSQAIKTAGVDAFRIGVILQASWNWPVDFTLMTLINAVVEALPAALRIVSGQWVVRTGLRFPGVEGDMIEFVNAEGEPATGIITAVSKLEARAYVNPSIGVEVSEETIAVAAEDVYANVTQARYSTERPVLGSRYINAPALAAEAEKERARNRLKSTAPAASPETAHPLAGSRCDFFVDDPIPPSVA